MTNGFLTDLVILTKTSLAPEDFFSSDYEKVITLREFNIGVNDNHMKSFY